MRLYLAGADSSADHRATIGIKNEAYLISYWYILKGYGQQVIDYGFNAGLPLMLDSGAFSAMHSGAVIDIDRYIDYIAEHGHKFEKIISLDVIGDWRGSDRNLDYMVSNGVVPVPVFHTREPFDYLETLLRDYDSIALGVTGSKLRQPQIIAWLIEVFKRRQKVKPDCKIHGLALTSSRIMRFFEWDSCDSSTWLNAKKFAQILVERDGLLKQMHRDEWHKVLASDGVPPAALFPKTGKIERCFPAMRHNAEVMLRYVEKVNQSKVAAKSTLKN